MKTKRLGIEWGAAYAEAQPMLIRSEFGDELLIYTMEGGGLAIECNRVKSIVQARSTHPNKNGSTCLHIVIED